MSRGPHSYDARDTWDPLPPRPANRRDTHASGDRTHGRETHIDRERDPGDSGSYNPVHLNRERNDSPRTYFLKDRPYLLRASELHALGEIGMFRVVAAQDLREFGYAVDRARFESDIAHLEQQSLVSDKTIEVSGKKTLRVLTLTKTGRRLLGATNYLRDDQTVYHGLKKPREAKHDADFYRLYHKEAARITRTGGTPIRVILDYELKRDLNRDLAQLGPMKNDHDPDARRKIAEKHGLEVVGGHIPLPDLRIDYQTADMEIRRVDLELATRHYRPGGIAEKAKAGFSLYARPEDAQRLRRILNDRELTAEILGL